MDHLHTVKPQVTFASLSSPAVMDVRPLRGRPLLAEVSKTIETIGTIFFLACAPCLRRFKDNRDNRDNFFPCLQAGTGRRNGLSLLSLLSLKKQEGERQPSCSAFYFLFPAFSI